MWFPFANAPRGAPVQRKVRRICEAVLPAFSSKPNKQHDDPNYRNRNPKNFEQKFVDQW